MKKALIGHATPEEIEKWKKEYKDVLAVIVEEHICYLKKPDRTVMAYASTALKDSPFQYVEEIFNNCKIGGSKIFDTDDDYFMSAMQVVNELVEVKKAELVKL